MSEKTQKKNDHFVIINGKLIEPGKPDSTLCNMLWEKGRIVGLGYLPEENEDDLHIFDASDCYILPPMIDLSSRFSLQTHHFQQAYGQGFRGLLYEQANTHYDHPQPFFFAMAHQLSSLNPSIHPNDLIVINASDSQQDIQHLFENATQQGILLALEEDSSMTTLQTHINHFLQSQARHLHIGPIYNQDQLEYLHHLKKTQSNISSFCQLETCLKDPKLFFNGLKQGSLDTLSLGQNQNCIALALPILLHLFKESNFDMLDFMHHLCISPLAVLNGGFQQIQLNASPPLIIINPSKSPQFPSLKQSDKSKSILPERLTGACVARIDQGILIEMR